jgi:hypothetical protein
MEGTLYQGNGVVHDSGIKVTDSYYIIIQTNLCKPVYVRNIRVFGLYRVNLLRFPALVPYLKFTLYRILVYSGFGVDRFLHIIFASGFNIACKIVKRQLLKKKLG